jgi:hypothetical protein
MTETRQYTITADAETLAKFERLLSLLHWNGQHGHSGHFGMPFNGDGDGEFVCDPEPEHRSEVQLISDVGYDVELAYCDGYGGAMYRHETLNKWHVEDGELEKNV